MLERSAHQGSLWFLRLCVVVPDSHLADTLPSANPGEMCCQKEINSVACNVLNTCNFEYKTPPVVPKPQNKYNISCNGSQIQWTLLVISVPNNCTLFWF